MSEQGKILTEKKFKSDISLLPEIQDHIKTTVEPYLSKDKIDPAMLAVSEAVSNAIRHGNKSDPEKNITVAIFDMPEKIKIEIRDEGEGFDISRIPDPTNPENLLKESGRGIFIIQNVIDKLDYRFTEKGTTTILEISK